MSLRTNFNVDEQGAKCVWCTIAGFGLCVSEDIAEKMKEQIPGKYLLLLLLVVAVIIISLSLLVCTASDVCCPWRFVTVSICTIMNWLNIIAAAGIISYDGLFRCLF